MTYGVRNVFDAHATGIADHPVSSIGPPAQHVRRIPRQNHGGLVNEIHRQILWRGRWLCKEKRLWLRCPVGGASVRRW